MARYVSANLLADNAEFDRAWERSAATAEVTADKIARSAQMAARSAAAQAKAAGASASEQQAAAARAAVSYTEAAEKITKAQQAAGKAAMDAAKAAGASADEQVAAWKKAVAATGEYEASQRRAADTAVLAGKRQAVAAEESAARVSAAHKKLVGLGKWTLAGGPGAGFFSVKGAADLQAQMERLRTQAGASQKEVQQLTKGVLGMAGAVGTGPQQLAQAMYHVTSAFQKAGLGSLDNAQKLNVLRTAAEGAKVGGADLVDVTNALDAAVVSGVRGVQNYREAMGALNKTVGAGDMTMQNLADALSTGLLGPMKTYGLSIKDVGGALAVFGDNNIRGQEAATKLSSAVRIMAAPSKEAAKALAVVGISATQLADDMRHGGIVQAISDLKKHLEESGLTASQQALVITRAFGGRQSTGVQLLIGQLDRLKAKTQEVGQGAGNFNADWIATQHTLKFQLDQVAASAQAEGDKVGMWLLPKVHDLIVVTEDVTSWLGRHKVAAEALAAVIGGVLTTAVAVFAYQKTVAFVNGTKDMITGMGKFASSVASGAASIEGKLTGLGAASAATSSTIATENAAAGASFQGVATSAESAGAQVDGAWSSTAGDVAASDAAIESSNAAAGGSFGALARAAAAGAGSIVGSLAIVASAYEGIRQIIQTIHGGGSALSNVNPASPMLRGLLGGNALGHANRNPFSSANSMYTGGASHQTITSSSPPWVQLGISKARWDHLSAKQKAMVSGSGGGTGMVLSKSWQAAGHSIGGFSSTEQTNVSAIMAALTRGGLSTSGAAALAGNWVQESSLNPNEPGGLLAQWGGPRLTNEMAWAKAHGMAYNTIPAESSFALHELQSTPGLLAMLKAGKLSPQQLALAVENKYEEPKGTQPGAGYFTPDTYWSANTAGRETYAAQIYSAFSGRQTSGQIVGTTPSPSTLAAYNALVGSGTSSRSTGHKPTMRYYQHHPVGVMNEAQWQAFEATHSAATKEAEQDRKAARLHAALVKHAATAGGSLLGRFQNVTQSGTSRTLENALGINTSKIAFSEFQPQHGLGSEFAPTLAALIRSNIEGNRPLGGLLNRASQGSEATTKYQNELIALTKTGQDKLADKLIAAHKAAMAALSNTLIAEQKTRDGAMLTREATALKDQTTAIQNAMQNAQVAFQAQEKNASDMASATVQAMQDMQQTVNDRMAGMVQQIKDATQLSSDQSQGIVTAINDQTQIQVDQIGERGLYGLNLVAQQLRVQADITKQGFDQQIAQATQQLDALQMQADQQENIAKLNLDQVTAQQHALVAAAQQRLDLVTIKQDARISSAQAHADAVQLHVDSTLIGPAQMALDMNANASKSVQAKFQAQLAAATGLGTDQVAAAQKSLGQVQASAQATINAAQASLDSVTNSANQTVESASQNLDNMTNTYNQLLATAQGNLQSLENTAAQTEAQQAGQVAVTQGQAATQFNGSGLTVNVFGVSGTDPTAIGEAASWAIRTSGLAA